MADPCIAAAPSITVAARRAAQYRRNEPVVPLTPQSDDELLACLLISTWSLLTGRTLRAAAPGDLSAEELIEFWADDFPAHDQHRQLNQHDPVTAPEAAGPSERRPAGGGR
jgi:hypothetical protein